VCNFNNRRLKREKGSGYLGGIDNSKIINTVRMGERPWMSRKVPSDADLIISISEYHHRSNPGVCP
jgi:hypothetical protein